MFRPDSTSKLLRRSAERCFVPVLATARLGAKAVRASVYGAISTVEVVNDGLRKPLVDRLQDGHAAAEARLSMAAIVSGIENDDTNLVGHGYMQLQKVLPPEVVELTLPTAVEPMDD